MYRAVIEVTEFSQIGWDSYQDVYFINVEAKTKETCESLANKKIKEITNNVHKGDFNITLKSFDAKIKRFEKVEIL